jgi:hypothetical protein
MITQHQGLLLGIILLVTMSVICQLTNLFDTTDTFFDLNEEIGIFKPYDESLKVLPKMNNIRHINVSNCRQQPCAAIREPQAQIPCSVLRECGLTSADELPYYFTPEEIRILMLSTYHDIGREISDRKINSM